MIDTNALRGAIMAKGLTQQDVAVHLGITPKTFYSKMKRGVFGTDEMEEMGIIGPYEGSKPRQVLITKSQWLEMMVNNYKL